MRLRTPLSGARPGRPGWVSRCGCVRLRGKTGQLWDCNQRAAHLLQAWNWWLPIWGWRLECSPVCCRRKTCGEDHQKPRPMRHHVNLPLSCSNISSIESGHSNGILPPPPLDYLNPVKVGWEKTLYNPPQRCSSFSWMQTTRLCFAFLAPPVCSCCGCLGS